MNLMTVLRPCPFCAAMGSYLELEKRMEGFKPVGYFIACRSCGARGPELRREQFAINAWQGEPLGAPTKLE